MIAVRPVAPDEHHAFARVNALAMGRSPAGVEPPRAFEPDRALAACQGDRIVGVAETVTLDVSVPGGARLPLAGARGIGVLPTHRRRGVLTALVRAQLDGVHERGEPLAGLWTTAAAIYPRFGYGIATFGQRISVERPAPHVSPVEGVDVRFADTPEDHEGARSVYERLRDTVPGMSSRGDHWWDDWRQGSEDSFTVLADDGGGLAGYARYTVERNWRADGPANDVYIGTVMGTTPSATAALWRFLLEVDLVVSWSWFHAPVFDPLPLLVDDLRRVQRSIGDGLWLRLVDAPASLAARSYATDVDCVIEVTDDFCPWNTGLWHLGAGGCTRAGAGTRADLTLTASALASVYLGGVNVADLVRAGRAVARTDEVAHRLSTAFSWPTPPWAVTWF